MTLLTQFVGNPSGWVGAASRREAAPGNQVSDANGGVSSTAPRAPQPAPPPPQPPPRSMLLQEEASAGELQINARLMAVIWVRGDEAFAVDVWKTNDSNKYIEECYNVDLVIIADIIKIFRR